MLLPPVVSQAAQLCQLLTVPLKSLPYLSINTLTSLTHPLPQIQLSGFRVGWAEPDRHQQYSLQAAPAAVRVNNMTEVAGLQLSPQHHLLRHLTPHPHWHDNTGASTAQQPAPGKACGALAPLLMNPEHHLVACCLLLMMQAGQQAVTKPGCLGFPAQSMAGPPQQDRC